MAKISTHMRFEVWKQDPAALDEFWAHIEGTGGRKALRFRDACMAIKQPYTLMYAHVNGNEALKSRYESLLRSKADFEAHEALRIADEVGEDKDAIAKARLQVDTRLSLVAKWDDERYGNRIHVDKTVSVAADPGLLESMSSIIKRVPARNPVTLENEAVPDALPATVARR